MIFALMNLIAYPFAPERSVFWDNPLMHMYPVGSFDTSTTRQKYNYNKDPGRSVRYVPDKNRWFRLEPQVSIPAKGRLVLNLGDSSTWGWGLNDQRHAYPHLLNNHLPPGVHSVNLGVPGYSSLQGLQYLDELLMRYSGRIAVVTIYFGNNDATENGGPDSTRMAGQRTTLAKTRQILLKYLPLARVLDKMIARFRPSSSNVKPRVSPGAYANHIAKMISRLQQSGIKAILIEPPVHLTWKPGHLTHMFSLVPKITGDFSRNEMTSSQTLYRAGMKELYAQDDTCEQTLMDAVEHDWVVPRIKAAWKDELVRVSSETETPLVSIQRPFIEAEFPWFFVDYCHPSATTHAAIAKLIATHI